MQCKECEFGRQNRGVFVSLEKVDFFCSRAAKVKDEEAASILEPLLRRLAKQGECPHFKSWASQPDSYVAIDLPRKALVG